MKKFLHFMGRTFQLISLLALPSAIWVAEFQKSEAAAISIFGGAMGIFFVGWILIVIAGSSQSHP